MTSTANTFNSVGGFSVGIPPVPLADASGNVVTNVNTTGNVTANVVYATYYKLANGAPFTGTPGGNYNQLQFNNSGSFGGVPNVTWNGSSLSLGSVSNLSIGGGTNGYVLQTDGAGNLTWTAQSGNGGGNGVPGGTNTQIQFNNAGSFGGAAGFTFNNTTGLMTVPNTSVGNITAISSIIALGTANLGAVSNVTITGGSANYVLATDGAGNLSWVAQTAGGGGTPGGSNTQVQYNSSGNFAGSPNFTFNAATGALAANTFVGSGANLSNISAANVIGTVANATYATSAGTATTAGTANSVAGANVSGAVAYATTANSVAGANVSGAVGLATYATTANAVAGANVSGAVAFATTANSVAGANVTGEVSHAAIANSVAGANVTGAVAYATTANSVAGANVSGAVAYATTANSVAGANVNGPVTALNANISNVKISGGTNGYVLQTDGAGNLSWTAQTGGGGNGTPGGSNTQVQYNNSGVFAGSPAFEFDQTTNTLSVTNFSGNGAGLSAITGANVTGTVANASHATVADSANSVAGANVSGQVGNALIAGTVYTNAQPNITSVGTLTSLNVAGTSNLGPVGNITITGGSNGYILQTDGSGNLSWTAPSVNNGIANGNSNVSIPVANGNVNISAAGNANVLVVTGTGANITGTLNTTGLVTIPNTAGGATAIALGNPTQGNLVSNAVTLTNSSSVSNAIAQLNAVLGKLVPPSPPDFPAGQTLSITGLSTYRMTNYTQTDNTPGANKNVSGGTTVSSVLRTGTYVTSSITTAGPGSQGVISAYLNGVNAGNVTLSSSLNANGTYGNLVVFNNYDYHNANANVAAGFWSVFSANATGAVTQGWNEVYISDSATSNTNTPVWFYDSSNPGTPTFSGVTITPPVSPSYTYSSTVPHYNNTNIFTLAANVNKLSGNMYPTSDTFVTGTAGGAFGAPASLTYSAANITTPLAQNLYVASGNAPISTTSTIISGFGVSSTGPSLSVTNSYNVGTQAYTTALAANVLYKTGNVSSATVIQEANVYVGSTIGSGSGLAYRIVNPGSSDTPTYTGTEAAFNSQSGPLQTYDATVVANILSHNVTNYSTGYLPAGPNLSTGRTGAQYFTFKIVRTSVSKFNVQWSGNIAGLWVALPGSTIDSTSTANGWVDMSIAYAGAGIPGANTGAGGNGSNGCALGGPAPLNTTQANASITATFGTVSSSSTASNEIYVRIKLTPGQSVTALSLQTASN